MTTVRAKALVFVNGTRYRAGEIFTLPDGLEPGVQMEVVKTDSQPRRAPARPKVKKDSEPNTFSELAKLDAEALPDVELP